MPKLKDTPAPKATGRAVERRKWYRGQCPYTVRCKRKPPQLKSLVDKGNDKNSGDVLVLRRITEDIREVNIEREAESYCFLLAAIKGTNCDSARRLFTLEDIQFHYGVINNRSVLHIYI